MEVRLEVRLGVRMTTRIMRMTMKSLNQVNLNQVCRSCRAFR